jgi:hypothetical protein
MLIDTGRAHSMLLDLAMMTAAQEPAPYSASADPAPPPPHHHHQSSYAYAHPAEHYPYPPPPPPRTPAYHYQHHAHREPYVNGHTHANGNGVAHTNGNGHAHARVEGWQSPVSVDDCCVCVCAAVWPALPVICAHVETVQASPDTRARHGAWTFHSDRRGPERRDGFFFHVAAQLGVAKRRRNAEWGRVGCE